VGRQRWNHLLFAHWAVDPAAVQATLPPGLYVDVFADDAYLGIVPFALWAQTHHPSVMLQTIAPERLAAALADPGFGQLLEKHAQANREAEAAPAWFQRKYPQAQLTCIAYFCMEFMLSEALPIYSGGLGNVAGDQLKSASDLGVPVVGVGLLYQHGYFRQVINRDGAQQALYPDNNPAFLPVTPVRGPDGQLLRLEMALAGSSVWLRAWKVQVGRRTLYLLDSNDPANAPGHRSITSELYGGDADLRLRQEIVLGIGGWRLLGALGIKPDVCHLNEGHAAFALLERARSFMQEVNQPFAFALAATRAGNLFTTHTAVAAGFDRFPLGLMEKYLNRYAQDELGIPLRELLALGRANVDDADEPFNMAYLATRGSGAVNGVSRLHGRVSRHIFAPLFPRWPEAEVPIGHITNGVHMPTWDSPTADALWTEACGKERWCGASATLEADLRRVPDEKLWALRTARSRSLVKYGYSRISMGRGGRQL
jgi:starch phosphorylase